MANNWIFIRGLTRGNTHWGPFPHLLQKHLPHIQAEFLELPGNGALYALDSPIEIHSLLNFFEKTSRLFEESQKFHLCGISLGGMVAMKWAELNPSRIHTVSVINSSLSQLSPFYQRLLPHNYPLVLKALGLKDEFAKEQLILKITSNKFSETQKYLPEFSEAAKKYPFQKLNLPRQLLLANNIRIDKFPSEIPLQVLSSRQDRLVSWQCSKAIAQAFAGKEFIHPRAGHDIPLDDPEWLCEILAAV